VCDAYVRQIKKTDNEILLNNTFVKIDNSGRELLLTTTQTEIKTKYLINCGGLYADRVARMCGVNTDVKIIPFRGEYFKLVPEKQQLINNLVYPVPDPGFPFLGVHFTIGVDGNSKIGPTAIPVLWREQYGWLANFSPSELLEIGRLQASLFARNDMDFRLLARREIAKYSKRKLVELASGLVRKPVVQRRWTWGKPGIRAQLCDVRNQRLEMDFRIEGNDRSLHILNAVSPAFTCAFPFARFVVDSVTQPVGDEVSQLDQRRTSD
jgi:L-2-hydroxyglutarate oxidase LhgO